MPTESTAHAKHRAYHIGRLFSQLCHLQVETQGDQNRRLAERHFAAAMTEPIILLPLIREMHVWLGQVRRSEKPGAPGVADRMETEIDETLEAIAQCPPSAGSRAEVVFPPRFGMNEKGLFVLGYFHENDKLRRGGNGEAAS